MSVNNNFNILKYLYVKIFIYKKNMNINNYYI
jgi:hypothetical protein